MRKDIEDTDVILNNIQIFIQKELKLNIEQSQNLKEIVKTLYKTNNGVVKTIDFKMLESEEILKLGLDKINYIACFPEIQSQILELNDNELKVFIGCIKNYPSKEDWTPIVKDILDNIKDSSFSKLIENINALEDILNVDIVILTNLLQGKNVFEIEKVEQLKDYEQIKSIKTDEWIKSDDIDKKKLAVVEKLFGHDLEFMEKMLYKYAENIDSLAESDILYYIKSLQYIKSCESKEDLEKIYIECSKETTFVNKRFVERTLKSEFAKLYNQGLLKVENLELVQEEDFNKFLEQNNGDNEIQDIPIYWAGTDFKILITSLGAFSHSKVDQNYKSDWNRPSLDSQHFCASYIRNDMIGTAGVQDICYGFDNMGKDSLLLSGSRDIYSTGVSFLSRAVRQYAEKYYIPDEQINNTERYNEMDYKRIQNGEKKKPSYIIVFKRQNMIMGLQKAIKASKDWNALPIVIVDVDKCLENEKNKVYNLIEEYNKNPSEELRKKIYFTIRNNRQTDIYFCQEIDIDQYKVINDKAKIKKQEEHRIGMEELSENYERVSPMDRDKIMKKIYESIIEQKSKEKIKIDFNGEAKETLETR